MSSAMRVCSVLELTVHIYVACHWRRRMFRTGQVYTALKGNRAFLDLDALSSESFDRWKLFQPLLEAADGVLQGAPSAMLGPAELALLRHLHRNGHLHLYHTDGQEYYSFHTPLHLLYYQHQLLHARVDNVQVCGVAMVVVPAGSATSYGLACLVLSGWACPCRPAILSCSKY